MDLTFFGVFCATQFHIVTRIFYLKSAMAVDTSSKYFISDLYLTHSIDPFNGFPIWLIVVISVVAALLLVGSLWLCYRKHRPKNQDREKQMGKPIIFTPGTMLDTLEINRISTTATDPSVSGNIEMKRKSSRSSKPAVCAASSKNIPSSVLKPLHSSAHEQSRMGATSAVGYSSVEDQNPDSPIMMDSNPAQETFFARKRSLNRRNSQHKFISNQENLAIRQKSCKRTLGTKTLIDLISEKEASKKPSTVDLKSYAYPTASEARTTLVDLNQGPNASIDFRKQQIRRSASDKRLHTSTVKRSNSSKIGHQNAAFIKRTKSSNRHVSSAQLSPYLDTTSTQLQDLYRSKSLGKLNIRKPTENVVGDEDDNVALIDRKRSLHQLGPSRQIEQDRKENVLHCAIDDDDQPLYSIAIRAAQFSISESRS